MPNYAVTPAHWRDPARILDEDLPTCSLDGAGAAELVLVLEPGCIKIGRRYEWMLCTLPGGPGNPLGEQLATSSYRADLTGFATEAEALADFCDVMRKLGATIKPVEIRRIGC